MIHQKTFCNLYVKELNKVSYFELFLTYAPGGALDQILVGDVPLRFHKHTRSLYQYFEKSIPDLIPIFRKSISYLIFHTKTLKIGTVPYTKSVKIDTVLYTNIWKIDTPSRWHIPAPKIYIVHPPGLILPWLIRNLSVLAGFFLSFSVFFFHCCNSFLRFIIL